MTDPNPDDPLNREAAEAMRANRAAFDVLVRRLVRSGGEVGGEYFPKCQGECLPASRGASSHPSGRQAAHARS